MFSLHFSFQCCVTPILLFTILSALSRRRFLWRVFIFQLANFSLQLCRLIYFAQANNKLNMRRGKCRSEAAKTLQKALQAFSSRILSWSLHKNLCQGQVAGLANLAILHLVARAVVLPPAQEQCRSIKGFSGCIAFPFH